MYEITYKEILNNDVELMVVNAPFVAKNAKPGNFLIVRVDEFGERIPLTIVKHDETSVTIIYQKLGYSTTLLSQKQAGDSLFDVVGPLGVPTHIRDVKSVLGIAGGVGSAPLYPQLEEYAKRGAAVDLVIGGRTKEHLLLVEDYKKFCRNIYFATDDGSFGHKGFVTQVAEELYQNKQYDLSIAIGPLIMMKNTVLLNKKYNVLTDVSLNPIMIDGTGMCGNCRVTVNGETRFACVDGPDFPAEGIDFDELMVRQNYYKSEEKHICRMKLEPKDES
ncbi:MAG: sulfide/dihydroorotate dehydrogenase-like FAD/NAD-binding protein [Bacilli bacterium]|nr:sulfide/dihydroorotate dehydrogenase-like FAD/NAD-binding protein [Bacilli bacterium]MBN2876509.1 sulfide/dihydroorotate dehydrogenase-like FAD/NAD-binding protein [Bacilli bacterium]